MSHKKDLAAMIVADGDSELEEFGLRTLVAIRSESLDMRDFVT